MTWLVFGVSCLLVLAGAVSIISGAPIIQLERGWAEVISGTVALSSGGVVFALAGILMRLESIRDSMAARSLPLPAESIPTPAAEAPAPAPSAAHEPVAPPAPVTRQIPPPEPQQRPSPATEDEGTSQGLWKRVKRPGAEKPDADGLRQHGFPDRVVPDAPEPARDDPPAVVVPAHVPARAPAAAPTLAPLPPAEPLALESAPKSDEAGQIGWLERSLFKGRPPRAGGDAAQTRTEPTIGSDPESSVEAAAPRSIPALPPPTAAAEPDPTPDFASEQHPGATVVGRYQAGSASYVMYSDGTIEVETESGETHRFGSMDELKAFIAQQDTSVS